MFSVFNFVVVFGKQFFVVLLMFEVHLTVELLFCADYLEYFVCCCFVSRNIHLLMSALR